MKHLLCSLLLTCAVVCSAQAYNPDANADGLIDVSDVLSVLGLFGTEVTSNEVCTFVINGAMNGQIELPLCSTIVLTVDFDSIPIPADHYTNTWLQFPPGQFTGQRVTLVSTFDVLPYHIGGINGLQCLGQFDPNMVDAIDLIWLPPFTIQDGEVLDDCCGDWYAVMARPLPPEPFCDQFWE